MTEAEVNRMLGARIKQVRLLRGMTQAAVARGYRTKWFASQSHYEAGQRSVRVYRLLQLSEILRVEPTAWLLPEADWCLYLAAKAVEEG